MKISLSVDSFNHIMKTTKPFVKKNVRSKTVRLDCDCGKITATALDGIKAVMTTVDAKRFLNPETTARASFYIDAEQLKDALSAFEGAVKIDCFGLKTGVIITDTHQNRRAVVMQIRPAQKVINEK